MFCMAKYVIPPIIQAEADRNCDTSSGKEYNACVYDIIGEIVAEFNDKRREEEASREFIEKYKEYRDQLNKVADEFRRTRARFMVGVYKVEASPSSYDYDYAYEELRSLGFDENKALEILNKQLRSVEKGGSFIIYEDSKGNRYTMHFDEKLDEVRKLAEAGIYEELYKYYASKAIVRDIP